MTRASRQAQAALRRLGDPRLAAFQRGFFQAQKGGYGEGDRFLGLKVPAVRRIARDFRLLTLRDLADLLASRYHEDRFLAIVLLVDEARRASPERRRIVRDFYLAHRDRINQWDLIDMSAPTILGPFLERPDDPTMARLARSPKVWDRRIAILAHFGPIRNGVTAPAFRLARSLLQDRHDLVHKALGWMLREAGQRDSKALDRFLGLHANRMPRTMLRYAIEKLPPAQRRRHMARPA